MQRRARQQTARKLGRADSHPRQAAAAAARQRARCASCQPAFHGCAAGPSSSRARTARWRSWARCGRCARPRTLRLQSPRWCLHHASTRHGLRRHLRQTRPRGPSRGRGCRAPWRRAAESALAPAQPLEPSRLLPSPGKGLQAAAAALERSPGAAAACFALAGARFRAPLWPACLAAAPPIPRCSRRSGE